MIWLMGRLQVTKFDAGMNVSRVSACAHSVGLAARLIKLVYPAISNRKAHTQHKHFPFAARGSVLLTVFRRVSKGASLKAPRGPSSPLWPQAEQSSGQRRSPGRRARRRREKAGGARCHVRRTKGTRLDRVQHCVADICIYCFLMV